MRRFNCFVMAALVAATLFSFTACNRGKELLGNLGEITEPMPGDIYAEFLFLDYEERVTFKLFPDLAPLAVEEFVTRAERGFYDGKNIHRVLPGSLFQGGSINFDGTDGNIENPEYFPVEDSPYARHIYGALAMVNMGNNRNYCQFYVVTNDTPRDIDEEIRSIEAKLDDSDSVTPINNQARQRLTKELSTLKSMPENVRRLYETNGGEFALDGQATVFGQLVVGGSVIEAIAHTEVAAGNSVDDDRGIYSKPTEEIIIKSVTITRIPLGDEVEEDAAPRGRGGRNTEPPVTPAPEPVTEPVAEPEPEPLTDLTETVNLDEPPPPPPPPTPPIEEPIEEPNEIPPELPPDEPPEPNPPNAAVPAIVVDGVYYRISENVRGNLNIEVDEADYLGRTTSTVPTSEIPTENGQSNCVETGTPYVEYEGGIALLMSDGNWYLFEAVEGG
ncbi:MAG: peptidylprolyl isomerase [Oscillospiraceae bacterium]|nr:peptidylprolyl isomerase [Oscillospiraceae bacterium]